MRLLALSLTTLMLAATPLAAQDLLAPLEDLVEQLSPQPAPRTAPQPVQPEPAPEPEAEETPEADPPPLPRPRPEEAEPIEAEEPEPESEPEPVAAEPEPRPQASDEPDRIYQTACPALLRGLVVGEMLPPIEEGICGERSPLLVTAVLVNGREIGLSSPLTTNCQMAGAFADWVGEVDAFTSAALDSPVATVETGTSMMCRDRVGGGEDFVSEHGFANAVDVIGFGLEDGTNFSVEADWLPASAPGGRLLRQAHGAACGRFTTVLGPEANADHEDHLHLDLGCHGQSCTAQLCE
jgi:hypothetical protein